MSDVVNRSATVRTVKKRLVRNKTKIDQIYYDAYNNPVKVFPGERKWITYVEIEKRAMPVEDGEA